jgi:hypothetical protein
MNDNIYMVVIWSFTNAFLKIVGKVHFCGSLNKSYSPDNVVYNKYVFS